MFFAAAAKIFQGLWILGRLAAAVRRGERLRFAMDTGDGSPIMTSIGESNWVRERASGPRALRLGGVMRFS